MSDRPVPHVWQAAVATCWAMLPEKLPVIFEIAARENLDVEAVAAKLGRPLDNTRAVTLRPDGVAIIPIEGVIFPRASLFAAISGGVSADELATDLATALDDPGVSGILLSVDSPGGDVNGVAEVAAMIRAGTARKPTVAADFGQGDVLIGQAAVDAGLADRVGSFEDEVRRLQQRAREPRRIGTSGRVAAQGGSMAEQGFWARFFGGLGQQMDAEQSFTPAVAGGVVPGTRTVPPEGQPGHQPPQRDIDWAQVQTPNQAALAAPPPDPEIARLRAELARLRDEQRARAEAEMATRAAAFADGLIHAGRALPAEREALIAAHADAAADDLAHPREDQPSRVARLEERQAARPATGHLGELVPVQPGKDGTLTPLANLDKTPFVAGEGADAPLTLERRIQIMAMTDTGRAELKRQGIPIPVVPAQQ
jgi:hypothetical protein